MKYSRVVASELSSLFQQKLYEWNYSESKGNHLHVVEKSMMSVTVAYKELERPKI